MISNKSGGCDLMVGQQAVASLAGKSIQEQTSVVRGKERGGVQSEDLMNLAA